MAEKLVIIGNGMAAGKLLEALGDAAPGRHDIAVFGAEPRANYNRTLLSPVLAGDLRFEDIVTRDAGWYAARGIRLKSGSRVVVIDRATRAVVTADGARERYDRLVIATGSLPVVLPVSGADLPGVVGFRDLDDVETMAAAARRDRHAVVIGGGLLGLEAAAGLRARGMAVTVVHLMPTLMERQLDAASARLLRSAVEARGIAVVTDARTGAIEGAERVRAVRLEDGRRLPADIVVMAVGIRPDTALAASAGLAIGRGVVVDDFMTTSDPAILAIGECAEHRGCCYGLVDPLYDMARVAARRLAGDETARYAGSVSATGLKVSGIDLYSAGDFADDAGGETIVLSDPHGGVYRKLVVRDGRLVGAVLYGDVADGAWYAELIRRGAPVGPMRAGLGFGRAYVESDEDTGPVEVGEGAHAHDALARSAA
jgi:nitrite reductase (NADH) large subunit